MVKVRWKNRGPPEDRSRPPPSPKEKQLQMGTPGGQMCRHLQLVKGAVLRVSTARRRVFLSCLSSSSAAHQLFSSSLSSGLMAGLYVGEVGLYPGEVGLYVDPLGLVGEYVGEVGEYLGEVGE